MKFVIQKDEREPVSFFQVGTKSLYFRGVNDEVYFLDEKGFLKSSCHLWKELKTFKRFTPLYPNSSITITF